MSKTTEKLFDKFLNKFSPKILKNLVEICGMR